MIALFILAALLVFIVGVAAGFIWAAWLVENAPSDRTVPEHPTDKELLSYDQPSHFNGAMRVHDLCGYAWAIHDLKSTSSWWGCPESEQEAADRWGR